MNRSLKLLCLLPLAASLCLAALPSSAAQPWLIATPDETAHAAAPITLDIVKPDAQADWPEIVRLRLKCKERVLEIELTAVGQVMQEQSRRTYRGVLPANLSGMVRIDLVGAESNRLALVVSAPDVIEKMKSAGSNAGIPITQPGDTGNLIFPVNEPALSANEPMYFVVGGNGGATARFQLSFKYRVFDPDSLPIAWIPPLAGVHFGYTQTSIWNIGAHSAPFRDTSYRPSLFWEGASRGKGLMPSLLRAGYEHESNGKDGVNSRSINTLFAQPTWKIGFSDGRTLTFAPKVYGYLDKGDNHDIQRYRGYVDWNFRYGHEDGWLLATKLQRGTVGHTSTQFDLSYPLRQALFAGTGGYLHFQLFNGYGETMLDYNQNPGTQVRVGFSIIR